MGVGVDESVATRPRSYTDLGPWVITQLSQEETPTHPDNTGQRHDHLAQVMQDDGMVREWPARSWYWKRG